MPHNPELPLVDPDEPTDSFAFDAPDGVTRPHPATSVPPQPRLSGCKPRGKPFPPGHPPGPGRPKGRRNNLTLALQDIYDGVAPAILRKTLSGALQLNSTCLKLMVPLLPLYRDRIAIALPDVASSDDIPRYLNAVTKALRRGEISVAEAAQLFSFADILRTAFETQMMQRALEQNRPAPQPLAAPSDGAVPSGPETSDAQ